MPWTLRMLLIFALAGALFQYYVARKAVSAFSLVTGWRRQRIRLTALAILFWMVLYPILMVGSYSLGLGGVSRALQTSTLLDALFTYPFWLGVILAIQLALFFLILDAVKLLLYPLYKRHKDRWLRAQSWAVITLICVGAVYVVARFYNDTFTVRVRETEAAIADLPAELDGFRIAHIADLQADVRTNGSKLQAYVETVNGLKPDLILFAGDLVTSGTDYIETGAQTLGKMQATHGIYACLGDHDFFSNREMVTRNLEKNGVNVLANIATAVPVGSTLISLTGVTNVYPSRPSPGILETIERQRPKGPVNIFLTHQPSPRWITDHALERGYNLFLAGHTHGGQIVFPLPGFLLTGSSFETRYVTGFYKLGPMLVSINNGLGLTLAAVRYHAPAEVTLISLRAAK